MSFNDEMKKVLLAGIGAVATTAEKSKEMVDGFVKKGEITVEQGKILNEELMRNIKEKVNEHISVTIVKDNCESNPSFADKLDQLTPAQLRELKAKLDALDMEPVEEPVNETVEETTEESVAEECVEEPVVNDTTDSPESESCSNEDKNCDC